MLLGDGLEVGVGVEWGGCRTEGRVGLEKDTVRLAVLLQLVLGAVRVELDLDHQQRSINNKRNLPG